MRTFILSALVTLCASLPMGSQAASIPFSATTVQSIAPDVNPELVERILYRVHEDEGIEQEKLCKLWCEGKIQISECSAGYVVSVTKESGTVIISVIDDL